MPRFVSRVTGAVVSLDEAAARRLGPEWEAEREKSQGRPRKADGKSDDKK